MKKLLILSIVILIFTINESYSQELGFKKGTITTGIGLGINSGQEEIGLGLVYSIGWQRAFGEKENLD